MTTTRSHPRPRLVLGALASSLVLAASAASVTAATAANAAEGDEHRVVHRDARADVLRFPDEGSGTGKPAPGDRATDVVRTVVDHQADQLVVEARVRALSRSGYRLMIAEVLTSEGRRYQLIVDYSTTPISSRVSLTRYGSGAEVGCPGATWSVDRSSNRVEGSVPTSCLGGPDGVRVGVGVVSSPGSLATSSADDSRTTGRVGDDHLELGPVQPHA
jgi:hypothetical protein